MGLFGKVLGLAVSVGMIVAGVLTANPGLVIQGTLMAAGILLAPKAKEQARQASVTEVSFGEGPREAIFGIAATAGRLMDAWNHGGEDGTDWETLRLSLADHRCAGLEGFFVGDKYVEFTGEPGEEFVVPGYRGQLIVYFLPGTEDQAVPEWVTANYSEITADDNAAGIAHVFVSYKADDHKELEKEELDPVWASGRPTFLWVVKGALCYDPRKDSTVSGGDGTHRWDDPSTREWTDNAAVCRYNWVRGIYACDRVDQPDMLLVGRGLTAEEAPPENCIAWANICDEEVPRGSGAPDKRYRVGAVIHADEPYIDTEERFAAAMAGVIVQREGSVEVEPGHAKTPVAYFTDDDLVPGEEIRFSRFRSKADDEWVNTVTPRYVEPGQQWEDHAAPIRRVVADVIADGGPREENLSLGFVTSGAQAQRCGEIKRRLGRLQRTGGATLPPPFAGIEDGDWIVWTSKRRTNNQPVTFRVDAYGLGRDWCNRLDPLREISADVFAWSASDEIEDGAQAGQQPAPTRGPPPEDDWTLTAELLNGDGASVPALVFRGGATPLGVEAVKFEYYQGETAPTSVLQWIGAEVVAASVTRKDITSVLAGTTYWAAVSYRTHGHFGQRRVLGPVNTDTYTTGGGRILLEGGGRILLHDGAQLLLEG